MTGKIYTVAGIAAGSLLWLSGCGDAQSPGVEFMPDMYRSPSLETYSENDFFADSMNARLPVAGTVPRGHQPYPYPNTNEGYEAAGAELRNQVPYSPEALAGGKDLYMKFCKHCHGEAGNGDGKVVTAGGHPPPPAYSSPQLKNLSEGKMFHSITWGKNLMGSHASQLNAQERWKIIHFIKTLQNPGGVPADAVPETEAAPAPPADVKTTEPEKSVPQPKDDAKIRE